MSPREHLAAWWAEVKAEMPAFHHRNPVEYIEEQFHRLEKRLETSNVARILAPKASTVSISAPSTGTGTLKPLVSAAAVDPKAGA